MGVSGQEASGDEGSELPRTMSMRVLPRQVLRFSALFTSFLPSSFSSPLGCDKYLYNDSQFTPNVVRLEILGSIVDEIVRIGGRRSINPFFE